MIWPVPLATLVLHANILCKSKYGLHICSDSSRVSQHCWVTFGQAAVSARITEATRTNSSPSKSLLVHHRRCRSRNMETSQMGHRSVFRWLLLSQFFNTEADHNMWRGLRTSETNCNGHEAAVASHSYWLGVFFIGKTRYFSYLFACALNKPTP